MRFLLPISFAVWNSLTVDSRPQGLLFPSDSIRNEPLTPISNGDDLFVADENPNNLSADTDTRFISNGVGDTETDPLITNLDDPLPAPEAEEHFLASNPLLVQNPFSCDTSDSSLINDDNAYAQQLQARNNEKASSCSPLTAPNGKTTDLFQTPKGVNQPLGQSSNNDDEKFNFDTFLQKRPTPALFHEDSSICPPERYGLSNTPVCDNPLKFPNAVPQPGQNWVTLYDVFACKFLSPLFSLSISVRVYQNIEQRKPEHWANNQRMDVGQTTDEDGVVPCFEPSKLWCCRDLVAEVSSSKFLLWFLPLPLPLPPPPPPCFDKRCIYKAA